ncbi:trimethylamine methyltransferase family protein [Desulforhopalus vacuolatus]|uniref:trimethylamine methyltransferase family protein n=1 Tax=Desulforhopalus vacuolatus TaxID=40414 RepID=UPI001965B5DF|nr:trimethylamine methyltransferase family protein [Desulforhopalus vacuolatus]MBM9520394.1 trimethylamine methyltransferase family protein [Desulforhopalus vacuolatus]
MVSSRFIQMQDKHELEEIHEAAVKVLETVGVEFQSESALNVFKARGAAVEGSRVRINRNLIETSIESAPSAFMLHGRNGDQSVTIGEGQAHTLVEPCNGCIYAQSLDRGRRIGGIDDLVNFIKLSQASDVCSINGGIPVVPSDVDGKTAYLRILFETLKNTDKPLRSNPGSRQEVETMFRMVEIAEGQPGFLEDHAAIYVSINPLSPLVFREVELETLMTYAEHRQPVAVLSCAMAGVSAPMSLRGTCVLQNAEILAGLVLTQLVNPGTPFIYAPASAVPDMKSGQYVTGSPESNLINIANVQLARDLYRLPTRTMAGLTDAKVVDVQAGLETMQNLSLCMMSGVSIINECLGVLDSIMTNSYEKFILDQEMISRVLTIMKGFEGVNGDLATEAIEQTGPGGNFLYHPDTLMHCRDNWQPLVSSWDHYEKWEEKGKMDAAVRASSIYKAMLSEAPDSMLDPAVEQELVAFARRVAPDVDLGCSIKSS